MVGNIPTNDKGRSIWLLDGTGNNFNNAVKSGILWLSTSNFILNRRDISSEIPSTTFTGLGVLNGHLYEMRFRVWRQFY